MTQAYTKKQKTCGHFCSPSYPNNQHLSIKYFTRYLRDENKPIFKLERLMEQQEKQDRPDMDTDYIGLLIGRDLRARNNPAMKAAFDKSIQTGKPVVAIAPVSNEFFEAHFMSAFQWAYFNNALELLQKHLEKSNVPMVVLECKNIPSAVVEFCEENKILDLYGNIEYEVDELRVSIELMKDPRINYTAFHHTCTVKPGVLATKKGTQYAVFTPWYRSWLAYLEAHPEILEEATPPELSQEKSILDKFSKYREIPPPANPLTKEQRVVFDEHYKIYSLDDALNYFISTFESDVLNYTEVRDLLNNYPRMSPHLAMGTVSTTQLINVTLDKLKSKSIRVSNKHATEYIRQLAWRDFYRHVMANWPHVCMFRPFQLDYIDVEWAHDEEIFQKWCQGKTGFPIIDASMRQLQATGSMPNRCRMIVACFLSKNLLIDWRYGERWFASHLVDFDFASNNGGWGFASSVGVDPQPYFRIFNPLLQSRKFDADGLFIRHWIPELKDAPDVHDPYEDEESAKIAEKNGYPRRVVDYKATKERALQAYMNAK